MTKVVEDGDALKNALALTEQLADRSLHSFGWAKKLITDSFDTSFETQIEMERFGITACVDHPDGKEGLNAFYEKRKPKFGND